MKKSPQKSAVKLVKMTMTTAKKGKVTIYLRGFDYFTIDWGDGSPSETYRFSIYDNDSRKRLSVYSHYYSDAYHRTITITGKFILTLYCDNNQLTSLDVSENTILRELYCFFNQLSCLDVSNNTNLEKLLCGYNQLTKLETYENTKLRTLCCSGNPLKHLDITKNATIERLNCNQNQLTYLDVSKNSALTELVCRKNQLACLDVSSNSALTEVDCSHNHLTTSSLNDLFETLHCNTCEDAEIFTHDNPGTDNCNEIIAKKKGWTVVFREETLEETMLKWNIKSGIDGIRRKINTTTSKSGEMIFEMIDTIYWGNGLASKKHTFSEDNDFLRKFWRSINPSNKNLKMCHVCITYMRCGNHQITILDVSNNNALDRKNYLSSFALLEEILAAL